MKIVSDGARQFKYLDENYPLTLDFAVIHDDALEILVIDLIGQQNEYATRYFEERYRNDPRYKYAGALAASTKGDNLDKLPKIILGFDMNELPLEQREFVFFHEVGHIKNFHNGELRRIEDEIEADNYALLNINSSKVALDFFYTQNQTFEIKERIRNIIKTQK